MRIVFLALSALISTVLSISGGPVQEPVKPLASAVTSTTPSTTALARSTLPKRTTTTSAPTTTTTTTTTLPLPEGKCSEWFPLAVEVGWPVERLEILGPIMWAESRCDPTVWGTGAYGLTQIQHNAHEGWLRDVFGITNRDDLYDPTINLTVALWLAGYAEEAYGCWAQPWYMSGDWCRGL